MKSEKPLINLRERVFLAIAIALALFVLLYLNRSDCMIVEGATYRSPQEVDNIVGGTMHPQVSFSQGKFTWLITDIVRGGVYKCKFGKIVAYASPGLDEVNVHLDHWTGALLWEGEMYLRVP